TVDGQCDPGHGKSSGSRREDSLQGGDRRHSRDGIHEIGLDINIIVRYLTQDDPVQSPKATELIERRLRADNPGLVSIVAMAQIGWVLAPIYRVRAEELAAVIERMLQVDVLVIESEQEVFAAMTALQQGLGSFADALIGALGARAGCSHTMTFDQQALQIPTFRPV